MAIRYYRSSRRGRFSFDCRDNLLLNLTISTTADPNIPINVSVLRVMAATVELEAVASGLTESDEGL